MASPPRSSPATSPPFPHHIPLPNLNNPRKRPSVHPPQQYNTSKRRKQSSVAGSAVSSAHPLRQTSFPPEVGSFGNNVLGSPSVESDITGVTGEGGRSVATAGTGKGIKKKGKNSGRDLGGSVVGIGKRRSERSATGDVGDEEEDEDDGGEGLVDDGEELDKAAERKNLSILVDAFDPDQAERYEMFRRVKLKKETVRKIANFTLAQSVPAPVITTINGYTKTFIGTLIERAREIQQQWAAIETSPPRSQRQQQISIDPTDFSSHNPNNDLAFTEGSSNVIDPALLLGDEGAGLGEKHKRGLGPLLPDHLREALRRYRRDGEGNATGLTGFSVGLGVPGSGSARLQGRRLFR
ncbi:MAG: hypothetical protein Q9217_004809 [Psora testacea]